MREGELDDAAAVEAAAQILDGSPTRTGEVVHRDVKPANVLLGRRGRCGYSTSGSRSSTSGHADRAGDVPGTLAYISPERLAGSRHAPAADVWAGRRAALGGARWRASVLEGSALETARAIEPGAPSLATMRPDLPMHLVAAVNRALRRSAPAPGGRLAAAALGSGGAARRPRGAMPAPDTPRSALVQRAAAGVAARVARGRLRGRRCPSSPRAGPRAWRRDPALLAFLPRGSRSRSRSRCRSPLGNHSLGLAVLAPPRRGLVRLSSVARRAGLLCASGPLLALGRPAGAARVRSSALTRRPSARRPGVRQPRPRRARRPTDARGPAAHRATARPRPGCRGLSDDRRRAELGPSSEPPRDRPPQPTPHRWVGPAALPLASRRRRRG